MAEEGEAGWVVAAGDDDAFLGRDGGWMPTFADAARHTDAQKRAHPPLAEGRWLWIGPGPEPGDAPATEADRLAATIGGVVTQAVAGGMADADIVAALWANLEPFRRRDRAAGNGEGIDRPDDYHPHSW